MKRAILIVCLFSGALGLAGAYEPEREAAALIGQASAGDAFPGGGFWLAAGSLPSVYGVAGALFLVAVCARLRAERRRGRR